jgi:hypothetical protein
MAPRKERYMQVQDNIPAFIVGLPEDSLEADLAKSKFAATIKFLKPIVAEIEARCKIKTIHGEIGGHRFQVDVNIITPHGSHSYSDSGWDLAKIFDDMSESLKKSFIDGRPLRGKRSGGSPHHQDRWTRNRLQ